MSFKVEHYTVPDPSWQLREHQKPAWRYLVGPSKQDWRQGGRLAELVWHRRAGKDEIALHFAAVAAIRRPGNYWHMLPQASQARKAIWKAVNPHTGKRRIDEAFPLWMRASTNDQEMSITTINGSTWQVVGSDNFNSLVGSSPAGVVYSEWALANPMARAILRPIFAENEGWQLFITTPRGRNHAYRTLEAARSTPGAFAQVLPASQTKVLSPERLAEELATYQREFGVDQGTALFEQEYECSFDAALLGAVVGRSIAIAEKEGRIGNGPEHAYDPLGSRVIISSDIGFHDTASWWVWQSCVGGFRLLGYIGQSGWDAAQWCVELRKYLAEKGWPLAKIYLPHDAQAKTFASRRSAVETFLEGFGPEHIALVPQVRIADRINAARRILPRCSFAAQACEMGLDGLRNWQFEWNEDTRTFSREPLHNWASHPGDAFSYGATVLQDLIPEAAPAPFLPDPTIRVNDLLQEHERMMRNRRSRV